MAAFPPLAVANEILKRADAQGKPLTIMQLLKLVYISHGWSLGLLNEPLVNEQAQAWQHGPVYPAVYREFRRFGAGPITALARNRVGGDYAADLSQAQRQVVDSVVTNYGHLHAFRLSAMTHEPNTPWSRIYSRAGITDKEIPDELVQSHYRDLAAARR